jgi:hypothetical protein
MAYKRIKHINEFKKLKPRKVKWVEENLEWDIGKEYYIYSPKRDTFYKRVFHGEISIPTLRRYIIEETCYFFKNLKT